jgi:DsbC/DsbD-like thiol-disulfide interchange protein
MHPIVKYFLLLIVIAAAPVRAANTTVQLLIAADTVTPGTTVLAAIQLEMEPGWHTYWKNPGESGQATEVKWQLPPGVIAGDILWPVPKKLPPAEVTTYGYEEKTVLIVPLTPKFPGSNVRNRAFRAAPRFTPNCWSVTRSSHQCMRP